MNIPKHARVEVRWIDIQSENTWIKEVAEPPIITTLGFFIEKKVFHTVECLVLAGSLGADEEISNTDIIPTGCVISVENLSE